MTLSTTRAKEGRLRRTWDKRLHRENPTDTSFEEVGGRLRRSLAWGAALQWEAGRPWWEDPRSALSEFLVPRANTPVARGLLRAACLRSRSRSLPTPTPASRGKRCSCGAEPRPLPSPPSPSLAIKQSRLLARSRRTRAQKRRAIHPEAQEDRPGDVRPPGAAWAPGV